MARDHLPLKLELHHRRRLLHARDHDCFTHARGVAQEAGCRVVVVHFSHEHLQRLHGNAVALLQLGQAPITERDAQDMADERLVAEACTQPGHVVVAPHKRDIGLLHQIVDDLVSTGAAVPTIAGDDEFVDGEVADQPSGEVNEMQDAVVLCQGLDDRVDVAPLPLRGWCVQDLREQLAVFRRKHTHGVLQTAMGYKFADNMKQGAQRACGVSALRVGGREGFLQPGHHFRRIKNQGQQFFKFLLWELVFEEPLHQRSECSRSVVDDVAQLAVFTVDIADDVDTAHGQGELSRQTRDLGHGAVDVWEFLGQRPQAKDCGVVPAIVGDMRKRGG